MAKPLRETKSSPIQGYKNGRNQRAVKIHIFEILQWEIFRRLSYYYSCLFLQNNKTIQKLKAYKRAFK